MRLLRFLIRLLQNDGWQPTPNERAKKLLLALLSPAERMQLFLRGYVTVNGINVFSDGSISYCTRSFNGHDLPLYDQIAAKYLMMKYNYTRFIG